MSFIERVQNHPVLFVLGFVVFGFGAGWGLNANLEDMKGRSSDQEQRVKALTEKLAILEKERSTADRKAEELEAALRVSQEALRAAQAERDAALANLGARRPVAPPSNGTRDEPSEPPPAEPARWVRLTLGIPAGFQESDVLVDGKPGRVLSRLPNYIDVEVPDADRPVTVRVENRGRFCEQTILPRPGAGSLTICPANR